MKGKRRKPSHTQPTKLDTSTELSKRSERIIAVYEFGYRAVLDTGIVLDPFGTPVKEWLDDNGYYCFCPPATRGMSLPVDVHKFVAFCDPRWGMGAIKRKIHVQHLDDNKLNNKATNLKPTTHAENVAAVPKETWDKRAVQIRLTKTQYPMTDDGVRDIRTSQLTEMQLVEKYHRAPRTIRDIRSKRSYKHVSDTPTTLPASMFDVSDSASAGSSNA